MNVNGRHYRTIWIDESAGRERLLVIDQRALPHRFEVLELENTAAVCRAILDMTVRGAGLIGATAAYGVWLAAREALGFGLRGRDFAAALETSCSSLLATRPTAGNLARGLEWQKALLAEASSRPEAEQVTILRRGAERFADADADFCRRIGRHGLELIRRLAAGKAPGEPVRVLTHCNAGWLAFVDGGSALSPIYAAFDTGLPIHVWVDETRPRNQGAALTAWELGQHGVSHALIADNAGGHLMQHGLVDLVLVGADRVSRCGDAANKIGTYLKALAAQDNNVPFYVALPSTTFDPSIRDGLLEIPIEERGGEEVRTVSGLTEDGRIATVRVCPEATPARNWAFDVTPARLITGLICERGVCEASEEGILRLFPEWARPSHAASSDFSTETGHEGSREDGSQAAWSQTAWPQADWFRTAWSQAARSSDSAPDTADAADAAAPSDGPRTATTTNSGTDSATTSGTNPGEGVVKFTADHHLMPSLLLTPFESLLEALGEVRTQLHDRGLIGVDASGIGYGNVSARLWTLPKDVFSLPELPLSFHIKDILSPLLPTGLFLVSGTGTGGPRRLGPEGYALVTDCDFDENRVSSLGPARPSSESMTHAAVYRAVPSAMFVAHVHCRPLFEALLRTDVPRTPASVPYGTPEMARAVSRLLREQGGGEGLLVSAGHQDGIFAWGATAEAVTGLLFTALERHGIK